MNKVIDARPPRRWGRRLFLVSAALVGGGLAVGAGYVTHRRGKNKAFQLTAPQGGGASFGAWLTIDKQGVITAHCPHQEMGQGIMSLVASLVAEELDASPSQMRVAQAPVVPAYANPTMLLDGLPFAADDHGWVATSVRAAMRHVIEAVGINGTGGSTATRNVMEAVQRSAATARAMLLAEAASRLGVPASALTVEAGVIREPGGRSVTLGDVAEAAGKLPATPGQPKARSAYRMLGKTGMPRVDVPAKVDGSALFGIDTRLPGQLYAAIRHAPVLGSAVQSVRFAALPPGVKHTVQGKHFVAAVGTSWHAARVFLDTADVTWTNSPLAQVSSASIMTSYSQALDAGVGQVMETRREKREEKQGDATPSERARTATREVKAEYRVPYLAHATMEPMNCTVWLKSGANAPDKLPACDIWVGNQSPILLKWLLADAAGVPSDRLTIHTPYLGGGFGRRIELDVMREAIEIAKVAPDTPVMTLWSREEDMRHGVFRPAAMARMEATLHPSTGLPERLRMHAAGPSVSAQFMKRLMGRGGGADTDKTNVDGLVGLPYALPDLEVKHTVVDAGVPVGFWRSVGHSQNAFFAECFVDACAAAARQDPLAYRLALLRAQPQNKTAQRFIKVLEAAATKAGWGQPMAPVAGAVVARGVAVAESFHSVVAEVAEVVVGPGDALRVRRVVAAVDCGVALDPVNVTAQIRGGVHFALSAALYGQIDIDQGRIKQGNYTDYRLVTLADAPVVDVVIVPSDAEIGGIGEVSVPPLAPAVANAVFAATGKPITSLPLRPTR